MEEGDPGRPDSARWIRAARRGEPGALDELCRRLEPGVQAYVRSRVGLGLARWVDPADIVQGVLLEVLGSLERLPDGAGEDELRRRLLRTAQSRIRDAARRHERDAGETAMPTPPEELRREPASTGSVSRADERRWMLELVERLPPKYADVVRLCALEGLPFAEAGGRLGLSVDAVRVRYDRARRMLAQRLEARRGG